MNTAKRLTTKTYRHFMHDSLYRNSIYLILSSVIVALLGLVFWAVSAHVYSADEIGVVVTLVAVLGFLTNFSLLGLTNTFIRYLPTSDERESLIGTAFIITSIVGVVSAFITVILLLVFEPAASIILRTISGATLFIIFSLANIFGALIDAIFIACRRAGYTLLRNTLGSITRLIFALLFIGYGASGLFTAILLSVFVSVLIGLYFVSKKINLHINYTFNKEILKWSRFSLINYVSGGTATLVLAVLPLIILRVLGAQDAAFYFIAYTVSTGLRFIPQGVTQSLFAEGSNKIKLLKSHTLKAIKLLTILMLPTAIFLFVMARYILLIFGEKYATGAVTCLRILIIVALLSPINYLGDAILNTTKRLKLYAATNIFSALATLVFVTLFLGMGLDGIAYGWLLSEACVVIIYIWIFRASVINYTRQYTDKVLERLQ
jgi:O-antigen/teichoic acid export membrane protein